MRWSAPALLFFCLAACGGEPARLPETNRTLVLEPAPADPAGEADAAVLFGEVAIGGMRQQTLLVRNAGAEAVELALGALAPPFTAWIPGPTTLAPGASTTLIVRFAPQASRNDEAILLLTAGDERLSLRLVGTELPLPSGSCELRVDTRPVRWSNVGVGYLATRSNRLTNGGTAPCDVDLAVQGDGFSLEQRSVMVPAQDAIDVQIRWAPSRSNSIRRFPASSCRRGRPSPSPSASPPGSSAQPAPISSSPRRTGRRTPPISWESEARPRRR